MADDDGTAVDGPISSLRSRAEGAAIHDAAAVVRRHLLPRRSLRADAQPGQTDRLDRSGRHTVLGLLVSPLPARRHHRCPLQHSFIPLVPAGLIPLQLSGPSVALARRKGRASAARLCALLQYLLLWHAVAPRRRWTRRRRRPRRARRTAELGGQLQILARRHGWHLCLCAAPASKRLRWASGDWMADLSGYSESESIARVGCAEDGRGVKCLLPG